MGNLLTILLFLGEKKNECKHCKSEFKFKTVGLNPSWLIGHV